MDKENQKNKEQEHKGNQDNTFGDGGADVAPRLVLTSENDRPRLDADLAHVIEAWPDLPEAIRRAVLALIGSAHAT
jgi:hypothetical protein